MKLLAPMLTATMLWTFAVAASAGATGVCSPLKARPLLENPTAMIYEYRAGVAGCVKTGAGPLVPLSGDTFYRPPVMALAGDTAAVVGFDLEDGLTVRVVTLRQNGFVRIFNRPIGRVGAIKVRADHTVAFVSCPPERRDSQDRLPVVPGPHCVTADNRAASVYLSVRGGRLRRLAQAPRISPTSLTLSATTVAWRQSGRTRRHTYR